MLDFGNLEEVESVIFRIGSLQIKNKVCLAKTNIKKQSRMNSMYVRGYNTKKYSDISTVGALHIETSDYLIFSYFNKDLNKRSDIYASYPHILRIRNGFSELYDFINEKKDEIYIINEDDYKDCYLNEDYEKVQVEIKHLVNNNSIVIILDIYEGDDEVKEPGVTLFFNDEDNYLTLKLEDFEGICYFLNHFDLLGSSQNLFNLAYMQELSYSLSLVNKDHEITETYIPEDQYGGEVTVKKKRIIKKIKKTDDTEA